VLPGQALRSIGLSNLRSREASTSRSTSGTPRVNHQPRPTNSCRSQPGQLRFRVGSCPCQT
jgi:hypothetical protein